MNDILLDRNGDLNFKNGDLEIGYSDNQHQEHILIANKGEYREFPELGVGIHQITPLLADPMVVDHPRATPFASPWQRNTQLAQALAPRDQVTGSRIFEQCVLHFGQIPIRKQSTRATAEDRQINKYHG